MVVLLRAACRASAAGIDSLFIAGGIHADKLEVQPSGGRHPEGYSRGALGALCGRFGAQPTYSMGFLEW